MYKLYFRLMINYLLYYDKKAIFLLVSAFKKILKNNLKISIKNILKKN